MRKAHAALLQSIPLDLHVELARFAVNSDELAQTIDLRRKVTDHVDITVNGKIVARGEVLIVDDHFAVKITEIVGEASLKEAA